MSGFVHQHRVRYSEADMQGVVYNSHYLTIIDDTVEAWCASTGRRQDYLEFDFMLKKAEITWAGSARYGDVLQVRPGIARWGRTSFTVHYDGSVGESPVFSADVTYVGVRKGTTETMEPPEGFKAALHEASPAPPPG